MKILGYNYKVIQAKDEGEMGAMGRFLAGKQTLQIAGGIVGEQTVSTILHEILEALNYHLDLSLGNKVISPLEAGLYQVLVDNGVDLSPLSKELEDENPS